MQLRSYQQDAAQAVIRHFQKSNAPAVVVLPTGSGKSLVIAALSSLAKRGAVLVLAHVKELVQQNYEKLTSLGYHASIFSAGLGQKDLSNQIIFASVQSMARHVHQLTMSFSLLIIDECHRVALAGKDQYHQVINQLRAHNPGLCILGLTATPYRLGKGWIYNTHYQGIVRTHAPRFFKRCVYELPLRYLIDQGYLSPVNVEQRPLVFYQFDQLTAFPATGDFKTQDIEKALSKQQRITPEIIADLCQRAQARQGVMIFAGSCQHAHEIYQLLPATQSALITGETPKQNRDQIIHAFKQQQLKYLVNVAVLTTGFDAPHVDVIAILRPTASVSLYLQMVGRGLRLSAKKQDCLLLDYAGNRFDLYQPEIGQPKPAPDTELVQVLCPACGFANVFWGRKDAKGQVIEHFGRRCHGCFEDENTGEIESCDYRFQARMCPDCGQMNDIAARVCATCRATLSDLDQRLKQALSLKNGFVLRCAGLSLELCSDQCVRITYYDEDGATLTQDYSLHTASERNLFHNQFMKAHWHLPTKIPDEVDLQQVIEHPHLLKHPDFVIAEKQKKGFLIVDKIFHYQGRYRKAHEMVASFF